jgi:RNA polymerase-associated protein CTR9
MKTSLDYSRRALELTPDQVHFKFNIAFVQFQIAQLAQGLPDAQRTLADLDDAEKGLDEAIASFNEIARSPNPPYQKDEIEQRASMGRNTMKKQLERAIERQRDYEEANASKLQQARELREAEQKKRDEERQKAEAEALERRRKILEEQQKLQEKDREYMERRADNERQNQGLIDDSDVRKGERRRKGGKRKKQNDVGESDSDDLSSAADERPRRPRTSASGTDGLTDDDRPRPKKRKLERKKKEPAGKYKSAEMVVDSDDEGEANGTAEAASPALPVTNDSADEGAAAPRSRKPARIIDEDEDDDVGGGSKAQDGEVAVDEDEEE